MNQPRVGTSSWPSAGTIPRPRAQNPPTGIPVFFCDPANPWQRGSNENTNGLLRQFFPKGTDFRLSSAQVLARVAAEMDSRPRKILGWDTPAERFAMLLASSP